MYDLRLIDGISNVQHSGFSVRVKSLCDVNKILINCFINEERFIILLKQICCHLTTINVIKILIKIITKRVEKLPRYMLYL